MNSSKLQALIILCLLSLISSMVYGKSTSPSSSYVDPYDIHAYKRSIDFGGYCFKVKDSSLSDTGRLGPNQNIFSDTTDNVKIDSKGRLILNLTHKDNLWQAAEVASLEDFGYGEYTFKVASRIDNLDPHVAFSIFLYKDDFHEVDIEFSTFEGYNSQFVVQPYYLPHHMNTFTANLNGTYTTYTIDYQPSFIRFKAYHGHRTTNTHNLIHEWTYTGESVPSPEGMKLRFNLYLRHTDAPLNLKPQQIIISDFTYDPL